MFAGALSKVATSGVRHFSKSREVWNDPKPFHVKAGAVLIFYLTGYGICHESAKAIDYMTGTTYMKDFCSFSHDNGDV